MRSNSTDISRGFSSLVSSRLRYAAAILPFLFPISGCMSRSLTGLSVEPSTGLTCVTPGVSAQFHAYGTYTEGGHTTTTQDITSEVNWSATVPAVSNINSTGLATGEGLGVTSILASTQGEFGNLTATSNIQVMSSCGTSGTPAVRTLTGLTIVPEMQTVNSPEQTAQFLAIGTWSAAPFTEDMTKEVQWQAADARVANVDVSGLAATRAAGGTSIDAFATSSHGSVLSSAGVLRLGASTKPAAAQPAVAVYEVGSGKGTVVADVAALHCSAAGGADGCRASLTSGTEVTLTATPDENSVFDGWSGNCKVPVGNPHACLVTVENTTNVAAIFDPQ